MTTEKPAVTKIAFLSTIFAAGLGFSLLSMFAISGVVNLMYDAGRKMPETQVTANQETQPAVEAAKPAETPPPSPTPPAAETAAAPSSATPAANAPAAEPAAPAQSLGALLASGDAAKGEKVSKKCIACHTFDKGGPNRVGPNLYGVVGRNIATHEGFSYSPAMTEYGQEAKTWSYEHLVKYLHKPKDVVPKTKMSFAGLPKDSDIADLIAYLRQQSDNPPPLPAP